MEPRFKELVLGIIGNRKLDVYNHEEKVGDIGKELDDKKSIDFPEAMKRLKALFGYKLKDEDYRKIEETAYRYR